MRILVTGAGGTLGGAVVPALVKAGHEVRALGPPPGGGGDARWLPGEAVKDAVRGCDAVVLLGRDPADRAAVAASCGAGVPHVLRVSGPTTGRARERLADAERLVRTSGLRWTVLRHGHLHQALDRALRKLAASPVLPVDPSVPWQPVDAREVAAYLAGLLMGEPRQTALAYGGPQVLSTPELVGIWLEAHGLRRLRPRVRYPGRATAQQRAGRLLVRNAPLGTLSWREWLMPAPVPSDDFAEEHTASPTSPATQPERDPDQRVYGGDEGYQRQTRA
ncbi:NAD(P)H-binding protein [Nonomuraea sp. MCN248]|uniref:NAD(P)H-binding protein n=1 Tax=Nonomuraea corallina TaxID=2989783 RepID=A0ABT4SHK9_9ACTN|nr:NAD(P)H-binding protein [Nonomuraea corallina]MDA0636706.1 NAD(P)H-binding protein [Nonomuraea corallina]